MNFDFRKDKPKDNDERIIKKFAWFPIVIKGKFVWLERVKIRQIYSTYSPFAGWDNFEIIE